VRHPGYLANLLLFTAYGFLVSPSANVTLGVVGLILVIWVYRIEVEENLMRKSRLGAVYKQYSRTTSKLFPYVY
jgi:protein-S-isoprenylcysteine O-methyltransferase Ste14